MSVAAHPESDDSVFGDDAVEVRVSGQESLSVKGACESDIQLVLLQAGKPFGPRKGESSLLRRARAPGRVRSRLRSQAHHFGCGTLGAVI